jgi:predicted DNA-binding transcriptional regulator AlpA
VNNQELPQPSDPLLSVDEVATYIGQPLSSVYKWSCKGHPHYPVSSRLPNGRLVTRTSAVNAWLEGLAR